MASVTGTPAVYTDAGEVLADTHTASAGDVEIFLCASERGASAGTSPGTLTYGGVNALATTGGPVTDLCQIAAAQRAHRWYHIPRANHPGAGSHAVACTWAGADNVAVAIVEVSATGTVTIIDDNQSSADATVPITAGSGDLTIGCAQANSATPAFSPVNGQTEYLESVWYGNTGHSVGVQTGVQTAASWSGAGSICASAFVIHEESGGEPEEIELGGEALGGGRVSGAAAPLITLGGGLMGGAHVVGSLTPLVAGAGAARGAGRSSASASSSVGASGAASGAARLGAAASPGSSATAEARGAGQVAGASAPLGVAQGAARGTGRTEGEAVPRGVATAGTMGAGRVTVAAGSSVSAEGEARGSGRITSAAPANELGGEARGAGYIMGSVTPTAGLAGAARGGVATASAVVTVRSVAAGIVRGVGRALGAVLSAIGLVGEARAAGRAAGRVGEIATYAPGPPERTRVAMSRALRSRVSYPRGNVRASGFRAPRSK